MSYKYMGSRDGNEYYKKGDKHFKKVWDPELNAYVYVYVLCFWNKGKVTVMKNEKKCIISAAQVNIGDKVLTNAGFQKVIHIHLGSIRLCEILKLETSTGCVLGVSQHHLVYVTGGKMKPAFDLKVNDLVETVDGLSEIVSITKDYADVRSIITMNGELIVDNIRVSSYAGTESMGKLLHQITAPIRFIASFNQKLASDISQKCTPMIQKFMINYLYS
eukprot:434056_1